MSIDAWHHHRELSSHGSLSRNHNAEPFPSALLPELSPNQGECSTSWPLGTEERALFTVGRNSPKPHSQETFVTTARGIDSLIWSEAYIVSGRVADPLTLLCLLTLGRCREGAGGAGTKKGNSSLNPGFPNSPSLVLQPHPGDFRFWALTRW